MTAGQPRQLCLAQQSADASEDRELATSVLFVDCLKTDAPGLELLLFIQSVMEEQIFAER